MASHGLTLTPLVSRGLTWSLVVSRGLPWPLAQLFDYFPAPRFSSPFGCKSFLLAPPLSSSTNFVWDHSPASCVYILACSYFAYQERNFATCKLAFPDVPRFRFRSYVACAFVHTFPMRHPNIQHCTCATACHELGFNDTHTQIYIY